MFDDTRTDMAYPVAVGALRFFSMNAGEKKSPGSYSAAIKHAE